MIFISKYKWIRVRVSKSLHDDLKTYAIKKDKNISFVVRYLVRKFLENVHEKEERKDV